MYKYDADGLVAPDNDHRSFILRETDIEVASTYTKSIADAFARQDWEEANVVSASHCQDGQGGKIYSLSVGMLKEGSATAVSSESGSEVPVVPVEPVVPVINESVLKVLVVGKEPALEVPITDSTTILEVKNKLIEMSGLEIAKAKVRLIFGGKILKDSELVKQIVNYAPGIVVSGIINSVSVGGTRRHRPRKSTSRKYKYKYKY